MEYRIETYGICSKESTGDYESLVIAVPTPLSRTYPDMQSKTILAPLTICSFLVTGVVVASHILRKPEALGTTESTSMLDPALGDLASSEGSVLGMSKTLLLTGITSTVPDVRTMPVIRAVPWERDALGREFRRAGAQMSCSLLEPGVEVIQPLIAPVTGSAGPIGRQSAFSLNLQVDKAAKSSIPRVALGAIESYLGSHQLTIQIVYYHTVEGQPFFGPQVRAAFVAVASPEKTTEAETMIAAAIRELRTLGLYWDQSTVLVPEKARTMILAFRYSLDTKIAGTGKSASDQEYELLFLHLLKDSTATAPKLAVFATSNARTELNLLETSDPMSTQQKSVIAARVRFGEFNMMGLYPTNPVVTGVYHQAQLSLPVDSVKALLEGFASGEPRSLSDVLDELSSRGATGNTNDLFSPPAPTTPTTSDPASEKAAGPDTAGTDSAAK
ncbi:MAG: hypothetical protein WKF77_07405 [Planctomycetaceae bacterium]